MIIDNNTSNVEKYGDIKEYKTVIKDEDIQHIITLLSSNLYSNPVESFIREITCNAWDSQVEAGTTDLPIIIKITNENLSLKTVSIRDYGTGLSEKQFEELYCSLGHSTKRHSNDFIGSFGIGRLSPLAVSNTVNISSYYNGTEFKYVMIKDVNNITINKLCEIPTEEKNGLKVTVNIKDNSVFLYYALKKLAFFPNVYIDYTNFTLKYNNQHYRTFSVSNTIDENSVLIGYVVYPLKKDFVNRIRQHTSSNIILRFNIGELDITPNRENLIYSKKTEDAITAKIQAFIEEKNEIIFKDFPNRDFNDYGQFYKYNTKNTLTINDYLSFKLNNIADTITYKGKKLDSSVVLLSNMCLNHIRYKSISTLNTDFITDIPIIILSETETLGANKKKYIESKVGKEYIVLYDFCEDKYKEIYGKIYYFTHIEHKDFIYTAAIEYVKCRIVDIDFESKEYKDFTKELKKEKQKQVVNTKKKPAIYKVSINYKYNITTRDWYYSDLKCYFINTKKGILITDNKKDLDKYKIFSNDYCIVHVRKNVKDLILKEGFTNVFTVEKLLQRKHLSGSNICSLEIPYIEGHTLDILPESLVTYYINIKELKILADRINFTEGIDFNRTKDEKLEKIDKIQREIEIFRKKENIYSIDFIAYSMMKKKICRINYNTYVKCKQNPLIQLLSRK